MNYLNNRITQQIDLGTEQAKGMYKYEIQVYDLYESSWVTVFVGNYYNSGVRYYTFDITDICRSRKSTLHKDGSTGYDTDVNIVERYRIRVTTDNDGQTTTGTPIDVAHIYTYPNIQYGYDPGIGPGSVFFDVTTTTKYYVSVLLQGSNMFRSPDPVRPNMYLVPQYPNVDDAQSLHFNDTMTFGLTIETGRSIQNVTIYAIERGMDYTNEDDWLGSYDMNRVNMDSYTHTFFDSFGQFIGDDDEIPYYDIDVYITWKDGSDNSQYRKVAEITPCKERYYLLWQDRYGSYQS
jgi:hypothetical protein